MPEQPTDLELRILKVLWQNSPMRVREIRQKLADGGHDIAHTSVITVLNIMVDKGFLTRTRVKNAFTFEPCVNKDEVSSQFVGDLVNRIFDGSASAVMANLLRSSEVSPDDLKEMRRLLNRLSREQKEKE